MKELYEKLKKYDIKVEEHDKQFLDIQKLEKSMKNKELFLALLIANSIVCYQLSNKGEVYWEEFCMYFDSKDFDYKNIIKEVTIFIGQSRNNGRFIEIKVKRLSKLDEFFKRFEGKSKFYYENMLILRNDLAVALGKGKTNIVKNEGMKTINFAVKIFSYGARNIYGFIKFPTEISIPIDSRLINLFEKYREDYTDINKFYFDLSKKLDIPMLHLDAILWVNHENLI